MWLTSCSAWTCNRFCAILALTSVFWSTCFSAIAGDEITHLQSSRRNSIEPIVQQLAHEDDSVRASTARALGHKGWKSIVAIPKLAELLHDEQHHVRVAALWSIQRIGRSLIRELPRMSAEERQTCRETLRDISERADSTTLPDAAEHLLSAAIAQLTPARLRFRPHPAPQPVSTQNASAHSETPAVDIRAKLQHAIEHSDRVDFSRQILAMSQLSDGGLPILLDTLVSMESYSPLSGMICDAIVSRCDSGADHVRTWLGAIESEPEPIKRDKSLSAVIQLVQRLPDRHSTFVAELGRLLAVAQDNEHRREIVRSLGLMGAAAEPTIDLLIPFLAKDNDEFLRSDALSSLVQIAPNDPRVERALRGLAGDRSENVSLRVGAWHAMAQSGQGARITNSVLAQLQEVGELRAKLTEGTQAFDSESSCYRLLEITAMLISDNCITGESERADLIERLSKFLDDSSPRIRMSAANALACYGPDAVSQLESILPHIETELDPDAFRAICRLVSAVGTNAVSQLAAGLNSFQESTRAGTYRALIELGPKSEPALLLLQRRAAIATDPEERATAIRALGAMGRAAASSLQDAMIWSRDRQQHAAVRSASALAIGRISPGCDQIGELATILKNSTEPAELRIAVARSLATCKDRFQDTLSSVVTDDSTDVAVTAALELARQGVWSRDTLRHLLENLHGERWTSEIWVEFEKLPDHSLPLLEVLASDPDLPLDLRENAVTVLGQCGERATPFLIRLLDHDELSEQCSLQLAGSASWDALPELLRSLDHPSEPNLPEDLEERRKERLRRAIAFMYEDGFGSGGPDSPAESMSPGAGAPPAPLAVSSILKTVRVFYGTNRKEVGRGRELWLMLMTNYAPSVAIVFLTSLLGLALVIVRQGKSLGRVVTIGAVIALLLALPAFRRTQRVEQAANSRPGPIYGVANSKSIELGSCDVTIPATHEEGELEEPTLLKLSLRPDPTKHIVVRSVTPLSRSTFYADLKETMDRQGHSVLVFIHGYNVDFDDAARRTAQMAHDLKFAGAPVFFSWPSQANWHQYRIDERQVVDSVKHVRKFLVELAQFSRAESIHLVAHSMGTRALTAALSEISRHSPSSNPLFHQVVLAAPDINAEIFRKQIAPAIIGPAQRVTLYASSNDLALKASQTFNAGGARAGDSRTPIIATGIETIDVSSTDTSLLGHSYYGDNPSVLTDLRELLSTERPAALRPNLVPVLDGNHRYWQFRPVDVAERASWSTLWR